MKKPNPLLAAVAASLTKANKLEPTSKRTSPRRPPAADQEGRKISVSLFPTDLAKLDAIRDNLAAAGIRVSASTAIQVALRSIKPSQSLAQVIAEIRAEDGRRKG